ncbi:hypothetical protein JW823_03935 [bacterium]|nr:hypothetical protein [candidate division CSSED10-310 bacterium]
MRWLRSLLLIVLFMAAAFFAGDYFNLPLWPTDILVSSFPVEIRLELVEVNTEDQIRILKDTHYLELVLYDGNGQIIRRLHADERGIARCVLREGRYSFSASIPVVEKDMWYFFVYPPEGDISNAVRRIGKNDSTIRLSLSKNSSVTTDSKETILRTFLLNADTKSALILASELSGERVEDVKSLIQIETELSSLPVNAYNSRLDRMERASTILTRIGIDLDRQILTVDNEILYIDSRRKAVQTARDTVIRSYVRIMQEFNASGQLINILEEWNLMTGNPELYTPEMPLPQDVVDAFTDLADVIHDVQAMIPDEIQSSLETAVELYESGDLTDARSRFMRLSSFIRNLNLGTEFEDTEFMILEYLEDIELIVAANHAIRTDRLEKALQLYETVARPNAMVEERRSETIRFLKLRDRGDLD